MSQNFYKEKYLKYKYKYLELKNMYGAGNCFNYGFQQHFGECWHDSLTMILFQSDILNKDNELVQNLIELEIDDRTSELKKIFSSENFKTNIHKIPISLYLLYLEYPDKIEEKKELFFTETNKYMKSLKERLINRLEFDQERYNAFPYLVHLNEGKDLFKELLKFSSNIELNDEQLNERYKILEKKSQEFDEPEDIGIRRQFSTNTSSECTMSIINIARQFNLIQNKKITHRAENFSIVQLAIEIIMLYIEKEYDIQVILLPILLYLKKKQKIKSLIENKDLIGINVGLNNSMETHAISLYSCNNSDILYDNNLEYPINVNWKESLSSNIENLNGENFILYYADTEFIKKNIFYIEGKNDKEMKIIELQFLNKIDKIENEKDFIINKVLSYMFLTENNISIIMKKLNDYNLINESGIGEIAEKNRYINPNLLIKLIMKLDLSIKNKLKFIESY